MDYHLLAELVSHPWAARITLSVEADRWEKGRGPSRVTVSSGSSGLSCLVLGVAGLGCWGSRGQVPRLGWEEAGTVCCSLPSGPWTLLPLGKDEFQGLFESFLIWIL